MNRWSLLCFALVGASFAWMLFAPVPGSGNQEGKVKATVDSYVAAFSRGDGKAACEKLTDAARAAVEGMAPQIGATDCPSAIEKTYKIGGSAVRHTAMKIRVRAVDVDGGRARVTLRAAGEDAVAELQRDKHGWKIATLPKAS